MQRRFWLRWVRQWCADAKRLGYIEFCAAADLDCIVGFGGARIGEAKRRRLWATYMERLCVPDGLANERALAQRLAESMAEANRKIKEQK